MDPIKTTIEARCDKDNETELIKTPLDVIITAMDGCNNNNATPIPPLIPTKTVYL
jgi:hypothetical protein